MTCFLLSDIRPDGTGELDHSDPLGMCRSPRSAAPQGGHGEAAANWDPQARAEDWHGREDEEDGRHAAVHRHWHKEEEDHTGAGMETIVRSTVDDTVGGNLEIKGNRGIPTREKRCMCVSIASTVTEWLPLNYTDVPTHPNPNPAWCHPKMIKENLQQQMFSHFQTGAHAAEVQQNTEYS